MSDRISKLVLVTGAAGKVGQHFIDHFLSDVNWAEAKIRALCHNRQIPEGERLTVMNGSITNRADVARAVEGATHVVHLATCKETPDDVIDVTVKGLFWLLEECRQSDIFERFILIGGDASIGHFVYPRPIPVTETQKHSAYAGCYALSKVIEEVILEQYYVQYDLDGCCLRAPWIMEKDDFKCSLSFSSNVFGEPKWRELVDHHRADKYQATGTIPVMVDQEGNPVLRNFIHADDLITAVITAMNHPAARQQLFNIAMDEPVDYRKVARYLYETRGLPSVDIRTEFYSTWLDNTKAKLLLGWRPQYNLERLIDSSWGYIRSADDPRTIWYPG